MPPRRAPDISRDIPPAAAMVVAQSTRRQLATATPVTTSVRRQPATMVTDDRGRVVSRKASHGETAVGSRTSSHVVLHTTSAVRDSTGMQHSRCRISLAEDFAMLACNDDDEPDEIDDQDDHELQALQKLLDKKATTWRSWVYSYFKPPVLVCGTEGGTAHSFECCRCLGIVNRWQDGKNATSTSNLSQHLEGCLTDAQLQAAKRTPIRKYSTKPMTPEELKIVVVRWICTCLRPFSIVEDEPLCEIFHQGRGKALVVFPSANTIQRQSVAVYSAAELELINFFKALDVGIHITSDVWTSPNQMAFVVIFAHYFHGGKLNHCLLDIIDIAKSHTGQILSAVVRAVMRRFGLEQNIMAITLDNVSSNTTMVRNIAHHVPSFRGVQMQGHCILHILNLAARNIMLCIAAEREAALEILDDIADELFVLPSYNLDTSGNDSDDDDDGDVIMPPDDDLKESEEFADGAIERAEHEELVMTVGTVGAAVDKLRNLATTTHNSTTINRPRWVAACTKVNLPLRRLSHDVPTRWNSTNQLLSVAQRYKAAVDAVTDHHELHRYKLTESEWKIIHELLRVLRSFQLATNFFSQSDEPNISMVLRTLFKLDEKLQDVHDDTRFDVIKAAASLSQLKLKKYRVALAEQELYQFATIFHPALKTQFFRSKGYSAAWVTQVTKRMAEVFDSEYAIPSGPRVDEPIAQHHETMEDWADMMNEASPVKQTGRARGRAIVRTELDEYLHLDSIRKVDNVITWWDTHRGEYPHLAKMAIDYCSAPATTVDVERGFSKGRILLSHVRNRLSESSTHSMLCLKSWCEAGLIDDSMFL